MNDIKIRFMIASDIKYIHEIYTPYIKNTSITFDCEVPTFDEFQKKIIKISNSYAFLVCEVKNKIIGYAYASKLREREAYQWDAELSIYLKDEYINYGIGSKLYRCLIDILKLQNIYNVYGVITQPNEKSEKLHQKLGFNKIGVFHNTGYKFGKWRDVVWYEKNIKNFNEKPSPIISIKNIDINEANKIIKEYNTKINNISLK